MNFKLLSLSLAFLAAAAAARAELFNPSTDVVSLPPFVVEATRVELPAPDLTMPLDTTGLKAAAFAERSSERALNRLRHRLPAGSRQFVRGFGPGARPKA